MGDEGKAMSSSPSATGLPRLPADVMQLLFHHGAGQRADKRVAFVSSYGVTRFRADPPVPPGDFRPFAPNWYVVVRVEWAPDSHPEWVGPPRIGHCEAHELNWAVSDATITRAMQDAGYLSEATLGAGPPAVTFAHDLGGSRRIGNGSWRFGPVGHPHSIADPVHLEKSLVDAVSDELVRHWRALRNRADGTDNGPMYTIKNEDKFPISVTIYDLVEDDSMRRFVYSFLTDACPPVDAGESPPPPPPGRRRPPPSVWEVKHTSR